MVMEPEDRFGEYRVTVRFHDRNDGSRRTAEAKFRLEPLPEKFPPADLKRDAALIANYYRNPVPERLPGLLEAALKERPELTQKTLALYYGFGLLFRQNPQLWPELARIASAQKSDGARFSAAFVVRMLGPEGEARLRPLLSPEAVAALEKTAGVPVAVAEVGNSTDLDRLWMEFFASGQVGPVRRLVGELVRFRDALAPAEFKAKKEKGETTPADLAKVMNFLVGAAAKWSLGSNARQHPVVRFYLEAMLKRGEIKDPHSAALIEEILRKAAEPAAGPRK